MRIDGCDGAEVSTAGCGPASPGSIPGHGPFSMQNALASNVSMVAFSSVSGNGDMIIISMFGLENQLSKTSSNLISPSEHS